MKNYEGSDERQGLFFHGEHVNNLTYMNAAISGAIGSSGFNSTPMSRKRKGQEIFFGGTSKDPFVSRVGVSRQQAKPGKSSVPAALSSSSAGRAANLVSLCASKFTSLLSDLIHLQDVKELCSVLVVLCEEAARTIAESGNAIEKWEKDAQETSPSPSTHCSLLSKGEADLKIAYLYNSANQTNKLYAGEVNIDGDDPSKSRPMSPLALALRCAEQDTMFITIGSPYGLSSHPRTSLEVAEQNIT